MGVSSPGAPMRVGLVTASTAQLSTAEQEELSRAAGGLFAVVPLTVLIGAVAFADGEVGAADLCTKMAEGAEVSTSMATPDPFAAAFAELHERGAEAALVVPRSAELYGTRHH